MIADRNRAALEALDRLTQGGSVNAQCRDQDIVTLRAALAQQAEPVGALYLLRRFIALVPEPPLTYSYDEPPQHRTQEEHELGYTLHLAKELLAAPQAEPALWRTGMTEAETDAALAAYPPEQPAATDSEREECARWLDEQVKRLERDDIFGERRTRLVQAARLLRGKP